MNRLAQSTLLVVFTTLLLSSSNRNDTPFLSIIQGCEAKSIIPNGGVAPSVAFGPKRHALMTKKAITGNNRISKESLNDSVSKISQGGSASKSTLSVAIFNLVKGIVGAGVLSLPAGELRYLCIDSNPIIMFVFHNMVYFHF